VCNKIDQITLEELELLDRMPHYCPVSAHAMWNMDGLLQLVWEYLDLVRIYTKPKGTTRLCSSRAQPAADARRRPKSGLQRARCAAAQSLHCGGLLQSNSQAAHQAAQVCAGATADACATSCPLTARFQVWGMSAKHRPQRVGKEHLLEDEDVVQLVKRV